MKTALVLKKKIVVDFSANALSVSRILALSTFTKNLGGVERTVLELGLVTGPNTYYNERLNTSFTSEFEFHIGISALPREGSTHKTFGGLKS